FYIVTELVNGSTLRGCSLGVRKVLDVAIQIANGLGATHAAGIVHRDLKPDNILLTPDGRIKILDFGLAKMHPASGQNTEELSHPGMLLGTFSYMSPEQFRGLPVDHRSDIFSLGVTLYELFTGNPAFRGGSPAEIMAAILRDEPAELPDVVPLSITRIVQHC